jgi:bacterioferritin (cytochrome b1)
MPDRRDFITLLAGGAALAVLPNLGCARPDADPGPVRERPVADLTLLNGALDLEHTAIFAYGLAGGSGLLGKAALAVGGTFKASHETHREALSAVITGLGGSPVEARRSYDFSAFELKNEVDVLRLALFLEMKAARAYQAAIAKLQSRSLLEAAARIMGDEVSHAAMLRAVLGKAPVGFFGQIDEVGFEG